MACAPHPPLALPPRGLRRDGACVCARGRYAKHLKKYQRHFAAEQLLVLKSEDLYEDAWSVVQQALAFAGLPVLEQVRAAVERGKENRNSGSKWGGKEYTAKLQPAERQLLTAYYEPHNKQLYTLIGRDMGWEAMS